MSPFLCITENKWILDPPVEDFPQTVHDLEMI